MTSHSHVLRLGMQFFAESETVATPSVAPADAGAAQTAELPGQIPTASPQVAETPTEYTIKHNGKEIKVTMDKLTELAEKGADYDRIRPSHEALKKMADKYGVKDISEFIPTIDSKLSELDQAHKINEFSASINKYLDEGMTVEQAVAKRFDEENKTRRELEERKQKEGEEQTRATEAKKTEDVKKMQVVLSKHPELFKDGKLEYPQEALELLGNFQDNGPLAAFELFQKVSNISKLEEELATLKAQANNDKSAAAAIGSIPEGQATESDYITSDQWDKMSSEEKTKRVKDKSIYKSMAKWPRKN
jgi:hypothetical protein